MDGSGRGGDVFGSRLANLTHIVVELSFPKGYHLTLIKVGRRGTAERKRMAVFPPWEKALRRD